MKTDVRVTVLSILVLWMLFLFGCGGRPSSDEINAAGDGINANDTAESISRDDYGRDESLRYEHISDSERLRRASQNKFEQGNTKGDDGTMGEEKEQ